MRGVNIASWFLPEAWSSTFFKEHPKIQSLQQLAELNTTESFQKKYKNHINDWIDLHETFSKLKTLGINVVRIPVPVEAILPRRFYDDDYDFMKLCL